MSLYEETLKKITPKDTASMASIAWAGVMAGSSKKFFVP